MTAGRVGKAHGRDGSFYVEGASDPFALATVLTVAGVDHRVERRAGTDERPLIRLSGIDDPRPLRGELLLVEAELEEGEWLAADLVGAEVPGHGRVMRVVDGPSCSVLELEDGVLVPFIRDAIRSIEGGEIHIDEGFAG